tara:strand:- start:79783 stop:81444 length:1662 start_codon:yes stop_codon:yes gene_type:complete
LEQRILDSKLTIKFLKEQLTTSFAEKVVLRIKRDGRYVEYTGSQATSLADSIATQLASYGLKDSDRVALLADNQPEWGIAYLAIVGQGMTAVPIDRLLKPGEYQRIIEDSGCRAIIVSDTFREDLISINNNLPDLKNILSLEELISNKTEIPPPQSKVNEENLAVLIYTSGTTGKPKGVMLSHKNIMSNVVACSEVISITKHDSFVSVLPLHHTFECTAGFLAPMFVGATVTYVGSLKSRDIVEAMKESEATVMLGVPLLYEKMYTGIMRKISLQPLITRTVFKLLKGVVILGEVFNSRLGTILFKSLRDKGGLGTIRFFVSGAAALPPDVAKGFDRLGLRILQGYGLTEASPVVSVHRVNEPANFDSVGPVINGVEIKILDPDENGVGEVVVRGPNVMLGYYNNPDATQEILKDGSLYTGDSGKIDNAGNLHIAGRLKNVIVTRAGKNIYPEEIEGELVLSPYIAEALVLGAKDPKSGEEYVRAVVVPDFEYFEENNLPIDDNSLTKRLDQEVRKQCNNLADYKRVRQIDLRKQEFSKTSTRKIKRFLFETK